MDKNKIVGMGFAIFLFLAMFSATGRILSYNYEMHIALTISGVVILLLFLGFFGIYKLAQRKKKIGKQVDEYFENKEKLQK